MKIGMIAMSGVRAVNEELIRVGLTLPGFVERSKVIASLPSLSLLTLAALTPPDIEVEYREVLDLQDASELPRDYDLVAITSLTAQIKEAYKIADQYRTIGVPVVMGGLHVTALPAEAAAHCTSVVIGEGEALWPKVIEDFRAGRLQAVYRQTPGTWFDFAQAPLPRFDLLEMERYNRLTVQTSRGCPFRCAFCASSVMLTPKYKVKPVEKVIAEIRRIKELWSQPFIEFADDNSFVMRDHYKQLLRALRAERVRWFTEADISIADDAELLELMREAGCRQVLIGLESPSTGGLHGIELKQNWKFKKRVDYEAAIRKIQSHGITVNGCFILGLDGDSEETFAEIYRFIDRSGLYEAQLTVLTPFPGTPLYNQLQRERRIIDDSAWEKCTLFDVNFVPARMSPERLQRGLIDLTKKVYDPAFVRERRERFFRQLRQPQESWADFSAEGICA